MEAEEDSGEGRDGDAAHRGGSRDGEVPSGELADGPGAGGAGGDAECAADHGQDDGLHQELVANVAAAGPERSAKPDLPAPFGHRYQHGVHHSDAADDERDAADGGEQEGHEPHLRFQLLDQFPGAGDFEFEPRRS